VRESNSTNTKVRFTIIIGPRDGLPSIRPFLYEHQRWMSKSSAHWGLFLTVDESDSKRRNNLALTYAKGLTGCKAMLVYGGRQTFNYVNT
jgi:hypothetical protein